MLRKDRAYPQIIKKLTNLRWKTNAKDYEQSCRKARRPAKRWPSFELVGTEGLIRRASRLAEGMLTRLVRVRLTRGPRDKGKETFRIKIVNGSPMILNGLALGGPDVSEDNPPSVLAGLTIPHLKRLTVGGSAEMVKRLRLKDGVRVLAADLSRL